MCLLLFSFAVMVCFCELQCLFVCLFGLLVMLVPIFVSFSGLRFSSFNKVWINSMIINDMINKEAAIEKSDSVTASETIGQLFEYNQTHVQVAVV